MPYKDKEMKSLRQRERRKGVILKPLSEAPITITKEKAIKLLKIAASLDKEITGLQGRENMLDLVRYGDLSMREVREAILKVV